MEDDSAMLDDARRALTLAVSRVAEVLRPPPSGERLGAERRGKGRGGARWTVVDRFERDGKRYVVAQQSVDESAPAADLAPRERAVLAAAAAGQHDKLIAYDLGLADSTVRVLLLRAKRKLGARSRAEAVARFRESLAHD